MNYLVTGGAGFIGSNIVEALLQKDHTVVVVDNLHTGSLENLKDLKSKSLQFIEAPCSQVLKLFEHDTFDGIFHFGIPSSAPMYKENHQLVGSAIAEFINILELAQKHNCKIVYASTSSLYNGLPMPFKEDNNPRVTDFYTEVRICMERLAQLYHEFYNVHSIGLRLFSVYGPRETAKHQYANLVSQFLWAMQKHEIPIIYGDGEQTRDFTYVHDVIRASLLAMHADIPYDIFNIGTGTNYTLNQVITLLNTLLKTTTQPKYVDNPIQNYVQHTLADTSKAETHLGFKADYTLQEGIQHTLSLPMNKVI